MRRTVGASVERLQRGEHGGLARYDRLRRSQGSSPWLRLNNLTYGSVAAKRQCDAPFASLGSRHYMAFSDIHLAGQAPSLGTCRRLKPRLFCQSRL
jgi:hypothetical protein